jgi:hypothetical protein
MLIDINFSDEAIEKYCGGLREGTPNPYYKFYRNKDCILLGKKGEKLHGQECPIVLAGFKKHHEGVYESFGIMSDEYLKQTMDAKGYSYEIVPNFNDLSFHEKIKEMEKYEGLYGVADDVNNILEAREKFIKSPEKYILLYSYLTRKSQPKEGGWRWHKWGEYIGKQNPKHEYLYDDKHIHAVLLFHFYYIP